MSPSYIVIGAGKIVGEPVLSEVVVQRIEAATADEAESQITEEGELYVRVGPRVTPEPIQAPTDDRRFG